MASTTTFDQLAASISKDATIAAEYLRQNNLPTPSLANGQALDTSSLPPEIQAACISLQNASLELHELVQGPRAILMNFSTNAKADAATIFQFALPQKIPLDDAEGITYTDLARQTGLAQSALETILRAAILYRVFREPVQGRVAHSAASRLWATDPVVNDLLGLKILDNGLHVHFIAEALGRNPQADEPTDSAASVLHAALEGKQQRSTWFDILEREPARSGRARTAMNMIDKRDGVSLRHLVSGYDWASLPEGSLVVDLGGGHGDAVVAIASACPHLRFLVQVSGRLVAASGDVIYFDRGANMASGPPTDDCHSAENYPSPCRVPCAFVPRCSAYQRRKSVSLPMGLPQLAGQVLHSHLAETDTGAGQGCAGVGYG